MTAIKKRHIADFATQEKDSVNTIRTIMLFGNNVSTYKFALCHTLLQQAPQNEIKYSDLRDTFLTELVRHYEINPAQYTAGSNSVTNAIDTYLASDRSSSAWEEMVKVAEKNIYNNVFDAFQNVGGGTIDDQYRLFEHDPKSKRLVLTDRINQLLERPESRLYLVEENQARWQVVEEAWRHKLSPNMLYYNEADGLLYSVDESQRGQRTNLRSAVKTLLPYQHGRCFYCGWPVSDLVGKDEHSFPDVDHFLPFSMITRDFIGPVNPDGIWNLVIACKECNRGTAGKFDAPPHARFFERLLRRNLLFVEEHKHSLKNAILLSLQANDAAGVSKRMHDMYIAFRYIKGWEPKLYFS